MRGEYDEIFQEYLEDRARSWPVGRAVQPLLNKYVKPDAHIADIGCGAGQLLMYLQELAIPLTYTGVDISERFIAYANKKFTTQYRQISCSWQAATMTQLPYSDAQFDVVCALASLQHVPSEKLRSQAVGELTRIIKPGGILIMTNWNLWTKMAYKKYDLLAQSIINTFLGYDSGDFLIPWKTRDGRRIERYYHSFVEKELTRLLTRAQCTIISNESTSLTTHPESPAVSWVTVAQKIEKISKR